MPERITKQLEALLEVLISDPAREWYGLELMDGAGLSSGTLYPTLHRLVADGWLERTREAPSEVGGSGRRLYRLTGLGATCAREVLDARGRARRPAPRRFNRGPQTA